MRTTEQFDRQAYVLVPIIGRDAAGGVTKEWLPRLAVTGADGADIRGSYTPSTTTEYTADDGSGCAIFLDTDDTPDQWEVFSEENGESMVYTTNATPWGATWTNTLSFPHLPTTHVNKRGFWCRRDDVSGREYRAASALRSETTSVFTFRYFTGLDPKHRLECEGRTYDIVAIAEEGRRQRLVVQAKERKGQV